LNDDEPMTGAEVRALPAILLAGFTCGVLDIGAAFLTWAVQGVKPVQILQYIASGLLGNKSFRGGWMTALLGLAIHFLVALSAANVFFLLSEEFKFIRTRPVVSGVLYGVGVYLFMYWVVKPLSAAPPTPFSVAAAATAMLTHIVCVGLPISVILHRYAPEM
jgi:uncharacterized membrane protein YagU involved in acid resistance